MILKSIRLCGFKSFYRKIGLDFVSGITAIVGPNGCGKSNIADAIRWVMGEQNPRVLRGKRMDDTIFKGTQHRKPLNMTEVTLSFDNSNGTSSLPYEEVTITRKLFRSGDSEYLINNTACRLKDVVDLVLDLGIGRDAYSLIEQRMIDEILNGRSGERRRILEEAAGIVKYKERRKQALRKLERTRIDLEQIQVLVDEVERSVRGLKRHVGKARRYTAYKAREKEIEIFLTSTEFEELSGREESVRVQLEALEEERKEAFAKIHGLEVNLREGKAALVSKEQNLDKIREDLRGHMLEVKELDERHVVIRERTVHRHERKDRVDFEIGESARLKEQQEGERKELDFEKAEGSARLSEISSRLESHEAERLELGTAIAKEEEKYKAGEDDRLKRLETFAEIKATINTIENERISLLERQEQLERQLSEKRLNIRGKVGEKDIFTEEIAELNTIVEMMSGRLDKLSRLKDKVVKRREFSDNEIKNQQLQFNNIMTQLEMESRWKEEYEGYPQGVVSIMHAKEKLPGIVGPLAEIFEIDDQFSRAVESGLGQYLKMIVVEDNQSALEAINFLRLKGKGLAYFLSLQMIDKLDGRKITKPPSWVIASGIDVVTCETRFQSLKNLLLGDLWIVPPPMTREEVEEYFKVPARIVSLDGSLLRDNVVLWGGSDSDNRSLLLQRSKRIEELEVEAANLKRTIEKAGVAYQKLNRILKGAEEEHRKLQRRSTDEMETLKEKEVTLLGLERENDLLQGEIKHLEEELGNVSLLFDTREQELRDLGEALSRVEGGADIDGNEAQDDILNRFRDRKSTLDQEIEKLRVEEATLRSLVSENEKRVERVEGELRDRTEMLHRLGEEKNNLEVELRELESEQTQLDDKRNEISSLTEDLEKDSLGNENEIRMIRTELDKADGVVGRLRGEIDLKVSEIQKLELDKNDLKNRIVSLRDRIQEKYNMNFSDLKSSVKGEDKPLSELKEELHDIKRKISNLGFVNFVALEEYEREEKRFGILREQRDDLEKGKESLEATIRKINRTARERFLETFDLVRENFRETFRILFRGGRADLIMNGGDDPLEADIDMVAQPFGKKLGSIDLLSGGERSLTALALLFAIYLVKPSPFCILDEADAALDDANVDRLLDMLARFSDETQFIIITHNKKTMSVANCLYGVTMEEPGISKVVSVTLDGNEGKN
jgi:chromosome segregation protein